MLRDITCLDINRGILQARSGLRWERGVRTTAVATAKAKLHWEKLAKDKDWNQVRVDLSVYRYSGEDVKEERLHG